MIMKELFTVVSSKSKQAFHLQNSYGNINVMTLECCSAYSGLLVERRTSVSQIRGSIPG